MFLAGYLHMPGKCFYYFWQRSTTADGGAFMIDGRENPKSRITLTMDEEVECKALHNALDKSDRDLPLYAAVVFIS
jgi:hypothetical protein